MSLHSSDVNTTTIKAMVTHDSSNQRSTTFVTPGDLVGSLTAMTLDPSHPPSSIIVALSSPTGSSSQYEPTGIPYSLNQFIPPPNGMPPQPRDTTMVQVGFDYSLNYPFVLANSLSQDQIFKYLHIGIAFGLGLNETNVTMQSLQAVDNIAQLNYISTLAYVFIPSSSVGQLESYINTRDSPLYRNPNLSARSLMSYIEPAWPVKAGGLVKTTIGLVITASSLQLPAPSSSASSTLNSLAPTGSPTSKASPLGLSSGARIGIGLVVPIAILALALLSFFFWQKRKSARPKANGPTGAELDTDEKRYEAAAEAKRFELQIAEYELELPAEERKELQGDLRRRQELKGLEPTYELEAHQDGSKHRGSQKATRQR